MQKFFKIINAILLSNRFFTCIVGLLVIQALWIALSARYPLAFDENFHFGIIKLFSHQWEPFFSSTPDNSGAFGALTREPSYLYHYLMSFPYRLIAVFIHSETQQIILLRLMNIALFGAGLVAFRRLLQQLAIPKKLIHFSLLMFVLIPAVPFLAAHINYDNLLFLLIPITLSLGLSCSQALRSTSSFPVVKLSLLIILLSLASLVKYVFLPVAAAIVIYLIVILFQQPHKKKLFHQIATSFRALSLSLKIILITGLFVSGGLFIERYGINLVVYREIVPECSRLETVEHCQQYGPWARNQLLSEGMKTSPTLVDANILSFASAWVYDLLYRLYFAINYDYSTKAPLPIPFMLARVVTIAGLVSVVAWGISVLRRYPKLLLPLGATVLYAGSLFYKNYLDYLAYGERVAINGRYFIPFLPIIFVLVGLCLNRLINDSFRNYSAQVKSVLAVLLLLIALQGGGLLTFLVLSDTGWYWNNSTVIAINQAVQNIISPFIIR
ncbi:MAG: hypothetical protein JWM00_173 [Candidatus Saccharibacteria bacterium]|nr:hypothetical protein [Candidatus Saccharibacteria bacterium]